MSYREIEFKNSQTLDILEEEFKKHRSSHITWDQLMKNKKLQQFFNIYDLYKTNDKHQKKIQIAFCKSIDLIPATAQDQRGNKVQKYRYSDSKSEFFRRNEFQEITNEATLMAFVEKNPKGVLVSDELLDFTYREVHKDLERLISENEIKKINSSQRGKKEYYVFPNTVEKRYYLKEEKHKFFGSEFFLKICKDNYKDFSGLKEDESLQLNQKISLSNSTGQRFNEWVPGYAELKKQWLQKNLAKEKHKAGKK